MKKKIILRLKLSILLCSVLYSICNVMPVQAHRLVQTAGEEDEKRALINLGMLDAETGREENLKKAEKENAGAVVTVHMGHAYGSGVIFAMDDENIIIISNAHVLSEEESYTIIFQDGYEAEGRAAAISDKTDLGVAVVQWKDIPIEHMRNIRKASVSEECYKNIEKGDEIFVIGAGDQKQNVYEGTTIDKWWYLDDFEEYMMYNDCYAEAGMSGGGTFDAHGHFMGVVTGGNGTESVSLPLTTVLKEYEKLTLEISEQ